MRARAIELTLLTAVAATLALGCDSSTKRKTKDTENRRFIAECTAEGQCTLQQTEGIEAPAGKPELLLSRDSRMVAVCNVAAGATNPPPEDCRVLVCQEDKHCPPAHGQKHGTCVNRFCIEPSQDISQKDAVMLCLAQTGLGKAKPKQVGLYAMAQNCGSPCRIPLPCPQP